MRLSTVFALFAASVYALPKPEPAPQDLSALLESLKSGGGGKAGGGFPKPQGGLPKPSGGFPKPSGGLPKPAGGLPKPAGGIPKLPGGHGGHGDRRMARSF
ncbi:hypothetical protein BLS_002471 [Venturia inaequalis]|uniref:Uncharacterized protein n=1 Tax=Venturia inaequalis TaxID=5025 RepID=A0A8H3V8N7_VENIN|nr:hypothetical protein BLS_002471 [Venturia inaequalis]KAE9982762.1 hypothetical protein EG328_010626 [Venturia inaequalis]KAE9984080.1 hypothetical protein EG327_005247 [Venturia inaequalis]RDI78836.1 Homogentisate 1,2-dioxygenase [Venturia inaequalis]